MQSFSSFQADLWRICTQTSKVSCRGLSKCEIDLQDCKNPAKLEGCVGPAACLDWRGRARSTVSTAVSKTLLLLVQIIATSIIKRLAEQVNLCFEAKLSNLRLVC